MADLQWLETAGVSGKPTSCLRTLAKVPLRLGPLKGVVANWMKEQEEERTGHPMLGGMWPGGKVTHDHLVDEDPERPPVDRGRVTCALDHLGRDILCG